MGVQLMALPVMQVPLKLGPLMLVQMHSLLMWRKLDLYVLHGHVFRWFLEAASI